MKNKCLNRLKGEIDEEDELEDIDLSVTPQLVSPIGDRSNSGYSDSSNASNNSSTHSTHSNASNASGDSTKLTEATIIDPSDPRETIKSQDKSPNAQNEQNSQSSRTSRSFAASGKDADKTDETHEMNGADEKMGEKEQVLSNSFPVDAELMSSQESEDLDVMGSPHKSNQRGTKANGSEKEPKNETKEVKTNDIERKDNESEDDLMKPGVGRNDSNVSTASTVSIEDLGMFLFFVF